MDSNNIFFKIVVGVVLVGYMAFIFYQSLKVDLPTKRNLKTLKTHINTTKQWSMAAIGYGSWLRWLFWHLF